MTVTTEEGNRSNIWAKEPPIYIDETYNRLSPAEVREVTNARWAMCGIVAGALSYALTGKLFFGTF